MHVVKYRREWLRRVGSLLHPVMTFTGSRLVLGAETTLCSFVTDSANGAVLDLDGREARLLALLAAAYRRPIGPSVLDSIRRAGREWARGEACLAQIHIALSGLPRIEAFEKAAYRLFMADCLIEDRVRPRDIFRALDLDPSPVDRVQKAYSDTEPRVPKGSGRTSGEWSEGGEATGSRNILVDAVGATIAGTVETFFQRDLTVEALAALGEFIAGLTASAAGVVAALGLVAIPFPVKSETVEGSIPDYPDERFRWNREEGRVVVFGEMAGLSLPVTEAYRSSDGLYYDADRRPIGREINNHLVLDLAAVKTSSAIMSSEEENERDRVLPIPIARTDSKTEPKLCPAPGPDKAGRNGDNNPKYRKDRDYEDYVKALVNPDNPTPRGFGVQLPNPLTGQPVFYDDCQRRTDRLHEYKGTGYADPIARHRFMRNAFKDKWIRQARRQTEASGGRPIEWDFAELGAEEYARDVFKSVGLSKDISVKLIPWQENSDAFGKSIQHFSELGVEAGDFSSPGRKNAREYSRAGCH